MKRYKVGGAVRDKLLGRPSQDTDWVVIGATPDEMTAQGFRRVGKDFPVFLHPDSGEEYALARTERKRGVGYYGFDIHCAPDVTLEDDLRRRDLTINAIAEDENGVLVDPYGGQEDLKRGILRHVSPAFVEDPLRVLRVARFAATFGFEIAPETKNLMSEISAEGELTALAPERVWSELERALLERFPDTFVRVLLDTGALDVLLPEVAGLFGVPQPSKYHPEIDTGEHVCLALRQCAEHNVSSEVRFAILVHDLGKATTDTALLPSHTGHEERGIELVENVCRRYKVPNAHRDLAIAVTRYHLQVHRSMELRPVKLLTLLTNLDALRRLARFEEILTACEMDATGRGGKTEDQYPSRNYLLRAREVANAVTIDALKDKNLSGAEIGAALDTARVNALKDEIRRHAD